MGTDVVARGARRVRVSRLACYLVRAVVPLVLRVACHSAAVGRRHCQCVGCRADAVARRGGCRAGDQRVIHRHRADQYRRVCTACVGHNHIICMGSDVGAGRARCVSRVCGTGYYRAAVIPLIGRVACHSAAVRYRHRQRRSCSSDAIVRSRRRDAHLQRVIHRHRADQYRRVPAAEVAHHHLERMSANFGSGGARCVGLVCGTEYLSATVVPPIGRIAGNSAAVFYCHTQCCSRCADAVVRSRRRDAHL